ncbi:MAG: VOC family protein [Bacteroidota bacterium]
MATQIFVNLPVKDLDKSKKFYTDIGFTINPQFTNDKAACVVISETIFAMILTEEFFKTFIPKTEIADATKTTEVITALSADSKKAVDELANRALAAGGTKLREPEDHGFMYSRSFQDLDAHIWEVFWMDMNAAPPSPGE